MPNIKQIAEAAGVSISTVSRVLNNHPYVREDKRKAVEEAVERLQYSRNMNAVHLVKGATQTIGVVLPQINNAYFGKVVEGIGQHALQVNYQLMLCQTGYRAHEERKALHMLRDKIVDGLIIVSRSLSLNQIEKYAKYGPITLCEEVRGRALSSVYFDHYASFQKALMYLWEKGHRRIGYTVNRRNSASSITRHKAYVDTLTSLGGESREAWIFDNCFQLEDGARLLAHIMTMDDPPTALLITGDQVAAGLMIAAQNEGIRIPGELAIIGLDNQPISKLLGITTIDNRLNEIGAEAFGIIYRHITKQTDSTIIQELGFKLIERSTV
ncbi:LacI family DNA-binding transcriptional regulator [Paenibacillus ihumii]|uniref:LacI family DNA-binding transcriptional regulator n=1 Tax=Paenibacillus ihumii TaxID=687436 RepID=UPI0006D82C01|nr:LacI family DNA-binding transcriptional regulator [Paenibacillus ihumii]